MKMLLVDLWIKTYRAILFPLLVSRDEAKACVESYFNFDHLLTGEKILIVSHDEVWLPAWEEALKKQYDISIFSFPRGETIDLGHELKKQYKDKGEFDFILWYLSANQYRLSDLKAARGLGGLVARMHWDDEFNFFLPLSSSPLRDAHRFDFLFSSSSLAVCAYRRLGYRSELLFNGSMSDCKCVTLKEGANKIHNVVFVGSYTRSRQLFLSELGRHIEVFVYGGGWKGIKNVVPLGMLNHYRDLCQYSAIINLNFISLSNKYTHIKFRDFEFLGLGIPVIIHKSFESVVFDKDLICFNDLRDLLGILKKEIKSPNLGHMDRYQSSRLMGRTLALVNLKKE